MARHSDSASTNHSAHLFPDLMQMNGSLESAVRRANGAVEDSFRSIQEEALQFFKHRLDHTANALNESRRSKDFSDLLAIQQKWASEMMSDYYEGLARLSGVMQKWIEQVSAIATQPESGKSDSTNSK